MRSSGVSSSKRTTQSTAARRGEDSCPRRLGHDRTHGALGEAPSRGVGVETHDQGHTFATGRLEQVHVPRMNQVEDAVGEDDRTAHPPAPRHGRRQVADLGGGTQRSSAPLSPEKRALSVGGAMNVVTITVSSTAPNTSLADEFGTTADVGENQADLAARHHADADHEAAKRDPGRSPSGGYLPDHGQDDEDTGDGQGRPGGRRRRIEQARGPPTSRR